MARSAAQVKAELRRKGVSVVQWARANDLNVQTVYQLLAGRRPGSHGEAHRAAVLLGIKDGEIVSPDDAKSALARTAKAKR